jgi:hypothetical protein
MGRPEWHKPLYEGFAADLYPNLELVVLDESPLPSKFFTSLKDPRVRYYHASAPNRPNGVTTIGRARNKLVQFARGEFIEHRDSDDLYFPEWTSTLMERIGDADLVKPSVWRCAHLPNKGDATIFEWDTRRIDGKHYVVQGAVVEQVDMTDGLTPDLAASYEEAWTLGFGWCFFYRRAAALKVPFPETGTEDIPWARALREAGGKIALLDDIAHLALHSVHVDAFHPERGSPHFPQRFLGKLQEDLKRRMLGAGASPMQELPQGQPITIEPGALYTVIALLKSSHTLASIVSRAKTWGLEVKEATDNVQGDGPAPSGYRYVKFTGVGSKKVTLPWAAPKFMQVVGERSRIERAWVGAGADGECECALVRLWYNAAPIVALPPLAQVPNTYGEPDPALILAGSLQQERETPMGAGDPTMTLFVGAGASAQTVSVPLGGGNVSAANAASGSLLTVVLPPNSINPTSSWSGGVQSSIPFSCPSCQFILDGTPGTLTITYTAGVLGTQVATVTVPGALAVVKVPKSPTHTVALPPPVRAVNPGSSSGGMSTGAKVALGVAGAAVLAGGGFLAWRAGWFGGR